MSARRATSLETASKPPKPERPDQRARGTVPATPKGEATRRHLIQTAAKLFAEQGYGATTMVDLIEASGLAKGAFYFYFRSKEELALVVLEAKQREWVDRVMQKVRQAPDPGSQLRALGPAMLELHRQDPSAWSVGRLTRELYDQAHLARRVAVPMVEWISFVRDLISAAQADGAVRGDVDAAVVAEVLTGCFDGIKDISDVLAAGGARPDHGFEARIKVFAALIGAALAS